MGWCDPCAADPLSSDELRRLGVFWMARTDQPRPAIAPAAQSVFVTRLHVRYDRPHFPEDLVFQETSDRTNFQGRYVMRQPWTGPSRCDAATAYYKELRTRREREAQTLASLTGWSLDEIRRRMGSEPQPPDPAGPWWKEVWR